LLKLPFCYACGKDFTSEDIKSDDHVPPKTCFLEEDRTFPLKLPTHLSCNQNRHLTDEAFGQLMALKHGKQIDEKIWRLEFSAFKKSDTGATLGALTNVNIDDEIRRWIRCFHAALYQEALPVKTYISLETPFPRARLTPLGPKPEDVRPQHLLFVETIKRNRLAGSLDVIRANNGKLQYECVWDQADNGTWICIFALDLYSWKDLGDINNFQPRGCAGSYYLPSKRTPKLGAVGTKLIAPIVNIDKYDPFSP
jgi:hypothetical protein